MSSAVVINPGLFAELIGFLKGQTNEAIESAQEAAKDNILVDVKRYMTVAEELLKVRKKLNQLVRQYSELEES